MCLLWQGCTNPGFQVASVTKFCMVPPNICGDSVGYVFHVILLVPRILIWLLKILKNCAPLHYGIPHHSQHCTFYFTAGSSNSMVDGWTCVFGSVVMPLNIVFWHGML